MTLISNKKDNMICNVLLTEKKCRLYFVLCGDDQSKAKGLGWRLPLAQVELPVEEVAI